MAETNSLGPPLQGAISDEGYVGKKNEDAFGAFKIGPGEWQDEPKKSIYVGIVADGVTSTSGGAKASELTVTTLKQLLSAETLGPHEDEATIRKVIGDAIHKTNRSILEEARQNPDWGKMSTTLVLAAVTNGRLFVAHLGDSRAYLLRGQDIYRLTLDHTWGQEALEKSLITQAELDRHANRNVIRRYMGIKSNIEIDWDIVAPGSSLDDLSQRVITKAIDVQKDDVILLCSDGLTDKVQDDELIKIISKQKGNPDGAAQELINLAVKYKEQDNITALLLSFARASKGAVVGKSLGAATVATVTTSGNNLTRGLAVLLGAVLLVVGGWFAFNSLSTPAQDSTAIETPANDTEGSSNTVVPDTSTVATNSNNAAADSVSVAATNATPIAVSASIISNTEEISDTTLLPNVPEPTSESSTASVELTSTVTVEEVLEVIAEPTTEPETAPETAPNSNIALGTEQRNENATPTRRPTSTTTPTATSTSAPTPTYTSVPTATPTSTATPEPASTATRRPPPSPTPTRIQVNTPITQPTVTLTPPPPTSTQKAPGSQPGGAVATSTRSPALDAPRGNAGTLRLLGPENGESDREKEFCWTPNSNFSLQDNEGYELIFWVEGKSPNPDGRGLSGTTTAFCSRATRDTAKSVGLPMNEFLNWAVRRVITTPTFVEKELLSETRKFRFVDNGDAAPSNDQGNDNSSPCTGAACRRP